MRKKTIGLILFIIGLIGLITVIFYQQDKLDDISCEFQYCKSVSTLEYCFILKTDCKILEKKCKDYFYMAQWDFNCTYNKTGMEECYCKPLVI